MALPSLDPVPPTRCSTWLSSHSRRGWTAGALHGGRVSAWHQCRCPPVSCTVTEAQALQLSRRTLTGKACESSCDDAMIPGRRATMCRCMCERRVAICSPCTLLRLSMREGDVFDRVDRKPTCSARFRTETPAAAWLAFRPEGRAEKNCNLLRRTTGSSSSSKRIRPYSRTLFAYHIFSLMAWCGSSSCCELVLQLSA